MLELRQYQSDAVESVLTEWRRGVRSTLLILPTGCGKTVVFCKVAETAVKEGGRVLILAHRAELLQQAASKLMHSTGLGCAVEKAGETAEGTWYNVTVGSVQSLNGKRLERISPDSYTHIVIDECHHSLATSYMRIIEHFPAARILGVTATADRGDRQNLGNVFESVAFSYSMISAVRDGWLCRPVVQTVPLGISISKTGHGDYSASDCGRAIEPYLEQIAGEVAARASSRKIVAFLPLISTSLKFMDFCLSSGLEAREVNGESRDRAEILNWFHNAGPGSILCNSMLLTEGWDEPSADCVVVLRPTKVRSLYVQMVGRGTRLYPGKENLLILDFLWHSAHHDLCRPVNLVHDNADLQPRVSEILAENTSGCEPSDLLESADKAVCDAAAEREAALAKRLEENRHKAARLIDPLDFSSHLERSPFQQERDADAPADRMKPPTEAQCKALEDAGINPYGIDTYGQASDLLDSIAARRDAGLSTPKQIRLLERFGFSEVASFTFQECKSLIDRIAANGWRLPRGISPSDYRSTGK